MELKPKHTANGMMNDEVQFKKGCSGAVAGWKRYHIAWTWTWLSVVDKDCKEKSRDACLNTLSEMQVRQH